jgi:hypothetical protein
MNTVSVQSAKLLVDLLKIDRSFSVDMQIRRSRAS